MGFLNRLKHGKDKADEKDSSEQQDYKPPPGPPPSYASSSHPQQTKADTLGPLHREEEYAPPPGPPPSYHNWQSIPDTSLLPPPPALGNPSASTTNASSFLADRAWQWADANPPFKPAEPHPDFLHSVKTGQFSLRAPEHIERGETCRKDGPICLIKTTRDSYDHCFLSSLPLYFEHVDSPFRTERAKTIYYEMTIQNLGRLRDGSESSVAIGYCVAPYPTWRMPGWNRGSLAVHSDDGSRFMSHDGGGFDFTSPIRSGESIGLGVRFTIPQWRPDSATIDVQGQPLTGEVFFTRNGKFSGGWNIQEGLDASESWRADFLDGKWDLYAAIGTYGEVEATVNFGAQRFLYEPSTFNGL